MIEKTIIKYDTVFSKKGDIVFISHLDLMLLFRRAIRRSGVPFVLTKGFTPRVKISMPRALKLGQESDREEMSFWVTEEAAPERMKETLNRELPEEIRILKISKA